MTNAWIWLRASTDKQEYSVNDQRMACFKYAAQYGLTVVKEFQPEKGHGSGLTVDSDPEFVRMCRLAQSGYHGVKFLIVYDVSRLGRLTADDKIYWEVHFKKHGIQVKYVKDEFKNDGSLGDDLMKVVKHSQAHEFSMALSANTLRGAKTNAGLGFSNGGKPPYGYDRQMLDASGAVIGIFKKGQWKSEKRQRVRFVPNPTEKPIVQRMFQEYRDGSGFSKIADGLNRDDVTPPGGGDHENVYKRKGSSQRAVWTKSSVRSILRNEVYIGTRLYNVRSYKPYRRKTKESLYNAEPEWVRVLNAHEAIVDPKVFDEVQATFPKKRFAHGRYNRKRYLLSGLVVCANCGYRFNGWTKQGNGHSYSYYSCAGYHRGGKSICRSVNVSTNELEDIAIRSIEEYFRSPDWETMVRPRLRNMIEAQFGQNSEIKEQELKDRLKEVNRQLANIVQAIKITGYSSVISNELPKLESEKRRLEKELIESQQRKKVLKDVDGIVEAVLSQLRNVDLKWLHSATSERKQQLLSTFLHKVVVTHDESEIVADCQVYAVPRIDDWPGEDRGGAPMEPPKNRPPRNAVSSTPGLVSLKSIAGVGFEPTTFGL